MTTGIPFLDTLVVSLATEAQSLARTLNLGSWGTAGPVPVAGPIDLVTHEDFTADGWLSWARKLPAHPRRSGGPIKPWSTVVHTTDMLPDEWGALLAAWQNRPGDGACAHFLIGRSATDGVVQFVPVTLNGNHAGGPGHGVFVAGGKEIHPNLVAIGIEVHCAGGVRLVNGEWRLVEGGAAHGKPIPAEDVIVDSARPSRGYHKLTDYQLETLGRLLKALDAAQIAMPVGATTKAFGEVPAPWSVMPTTRVVTHAQLDPVHRADPWPHGCAWLREHLS